MATPDQGRRGAGHGHQRDPAIHLSRRGSEDLAVLFPDGSQILHHPPVARTDPEGTGLLRNFGPCRSHGKRHYDVAYSISPWLVRGCPTRVVGRTPTMFHNALVVDQVSES